MIEIALKIPGELRHPKNTMEKFLLRKAFDDGTYLPADILWRRKEGFSDGVGTKENPWYIQVQDYAKQIISDDDLLLAIGSVPVPITRESVYYYKLYHKYYYDTSPPIPHQWMPKWMKTNDPSGRIISVQF